MITQPSMGQLIQAIREQLSDAVIPALTDAKLVVDLQMMLSILDTLAVRCDHEIAWMREEIAAIEELASGVEGSAELTAALAALDAADGASDHLPDVSRRYDLAGEVLSCAVEAPAAATDQRLEHAINKLIHQRLAHEQQIVGVFAAAGR